MKKRDSGRSVLEQEYNLSLTVPGCASTVRYNVLVILLNTSWAQHRGV